MLPRNAYSSDAEYLAALRDWFARQAPRIPENFTAREPAPQWEQGRAWNAEYNAALQQRVSKWQARAHAQWAFDYADAMLAEREKTNANG